MRASTAHSVDAVKFRHKRANEFPPDGQSDRMAKSAYRVFGVEIEDGNKFCPYGEGAAPLLSKFGAPVLAAANTVDVLVVSDQCEVPDRASSRQWTILSEFPSEEACPEIWSTGRSPCITVMAFRIS